MGGQCKRVLRALERHPGGITQVDFLPPNVIDGRAPITRVAARINDLRKKHGYEIHVVGEKYGCALYQLARTEHPAPPTPPEPVPVVVAEPESDPVLFDMPRRVPSFEDLCPPGEAA